jgi:hypothetical protein
MSYEMNAEGDNGVRSRTTIDNLGITGPAGSSTVILLVRGDFPYPYPNPYIDVAGIQASGNNNAPGVVGYNFGGPRSTGVGVAGISQVVPITVGNEAPSRTFPSIDSLLRFTAGVYGFCQAGPGVLGIGSDADNPTTYGASPVSAGTGVVGMGGSGAFATTQNPPPSSTLPPITNPALPAGAGIVGLGSIAPMPAADVVNGAGVVGVGDRGGVFGSITSTTAQLRLIPGPPPGGTPLLPTSGQIGDLYITTIPNPVAANVPGPPVMFMCVSPSTTSAVASWVPFTVGTPQQGGTTPHS